MTTTSDKLVDKSSNTTIKLSIDIEASIVFSKTEYPCKKKTSSFLPLIASEKANSPFKFELINLLVDLL